MNRLRLLWFAIILSTIVYAAIAYNVAGRPDVALKSHLLRPLSLALYGVAMVAYMAAFLVSAAMARRTAPDQALILRLALLDSVCILGLMAAFTGHDWRLYLPAWVLGAIGLLRSFPLDVS